MKSNNPVFNRSAEFSGAGSNAYGNQSYQGGGTTYPSYGQQPGSDPSQWGTGTPGAPTTPVTEGPMTVDTVVQKTAISVGLVILTAAVTWFLTPDLSDPAAALGPLYLAIMIGGFGAFGLSMVNSFKKVVSPALVLAFAVLEGVALGAFSKLLDAQFGGQENIVVQAVIGTFAAFAGTLAAYKFFDIKVGDKFRTFVVAAMFGMIALGLLEMGLSMFSNELGLFGFGALGLLFAIGGLVLGVFMLILDFDFVERGVAARLPERESWRAAFAMTVSLVWIYTNLLRILAIMNSD
ncbi:Bax inhibitor-1/YccA family protein [Nocardioides donggukensis]|uniref:Bax inhibitor-1/YccA family protein n=1 Tax=Nocardioides donggukensis TaxID=2774019 RepID=A0A927K559_9ACTN|nr:Bax inhibitor-1/YccA family protein [Nocardioides donggukensis]MBD8870457.1 Bax inhibitor-1/YccA family protein [Nocardioides donggukensis]